MRGLDLAYFLRESLKKAGPNGCTFLCEARLGRAVWRLISTGNERTTASKISPIGESCFIQGASLTLLSTYCFCMFLSLNFRTTTKPELMIEKFRSQPTAHALNRQEVVYYNLKQLRKFTEHTWRRILMGRLPMTDAVTRVVYASTGLISCASEGVPPQLYKYSVSKV